MSKFNRLTIVAAAEAIAAFNSHDDMNVLEIQWDINQHGIETSSKAARVRSWAKIATELDPEVLTEAGKVSLSRAFLEMAIQGPPYVQENSTWRKLLAGLRFDGFEIVEEEIEEPSGRQSIFGGPAKIKVNSLRRMLPSEVPSLDFREAETELAVLLERNNFTVAHGHLKQAISAFQRGEWSSANGELRNFFESYLNEIATFLGYAGSGDSKAKRDFLGELASPFLLADYNEWHANNQKPQYVQGLMSRMHPHGGHPGLSEEEDATFRLQVTLITARLFLRRFDKRKRV
ncbi:hypothetical protein KG088_17985 [Halomonas sp. TRM85114]|uniref:hypothetical protein n=1 Tax=Halomonas jincaotanensis TaxID=2810616 RepID=UPI001BD3643C|nr:hypothetical protein [Halomonas jincaotanensis]MBS9405497.1 hypothetical protein [Halomonas jincaotanensis]